MVDTHRAEAAGYKAAAPEIRAAMLGFVERFADLCDEAISLTAVATALDEHSSTLTAEARSNGASGPELPVAYEEMVHALKGLEAEYGPCLARLWIGARRGRRATGNALHELFDAVERRRS